MMTFNEKPRPRNGSRSSLRESIDKVFKVIDPTIFTTYAYATIRRIFQEPNDYVEVSIQIL